MRNRLHARRPSPAFIVAILALIVALGGTALAAGGGGFLTKSKFRSQAIRGPLEYVRVDANIPTTDARGIDVAAACPPGFLVVGGGIDVQRDRYMQVVDSDPDSTSGWEGTVVNGDTLTWTATTTAICAVSSHYDILP